VVDYLLALRICAIILVTFSPWSDLVDHVLSSEEDVVSVQNPDIVVIMTDDLDETSLAIMEAAGLMPNLQNNIVKQGIRFTNSFATTPMCGPSRSTFFTGQYTHNHGVLSNFPSGAGGVEAFDDSSTVATWLQQVGYETAHIGKYLNGYGSAPASPVEQPTNPRYVPPGWDQWHTLVGATTYRVYDYVINHNGQLAFYGDSPEDYQTDVLANLAGEFIQGVDGDQSLFLVVDTLAPHTELSGRAFDEFQDLWRWTLRPAPRHDWRPSAPLSDGQSLVRPVPMWGSFNEEDVSDKPLSIRELPTMSDLDIAFLTRQFLDRLASVRAVDDLIQTVVSALEETGRLDDTVLVFTSDNGYFYGQHRLPQKGYAYEPSIRVPLLIRVPWSSTPREYRGVVLNNDLAPTFAQLAGATPDITVDGFSWATFLRFGVSNFQRTGFLVEQWSEQRGLPFDIPHYSALRTFGPGRLYTEYRSGPAITDAVTDLELYRLATDPFQMRSVHDDPNMAAEIAEMQERLHLMQRCAGEDCRALETGQTNLASRPGDKYHKRVLTTSDNAGSVNSRGEIGKTGGFPNPDRAEEISSLESRLRTLEACVGGGCGEVEFGDGGG
jgi:arylsulfatase A-like enzyme